MEETTAIAEQVRLQQWQAEIRERQKRGISVRKWCMERGLSLSAYYHRLRRIRETLCREIADDDEPEVVPIGQVSEGMRAAVRIRSGTLSVEIADGTSQTTIEALIRALKSC